MRTLYEILESILDDDETSLSNVDSSTIPVKIAQCFRKVFGNLNRVDDDKWLWVVGGLNLEDYDKKSIEKTEKKIEKQIREFFKQVKKELPGARCEYKAHKHHIPNALYMKSYQLLITLKSNLYSLLIQTSFNDEKEKKYYNFIHVISSQDEFNEQLCEICTK